MKETGQTQGNKNAGLELLRAELDECDKQIIRLLQQRLELARRIGMYKVDHNLPVLDEKRERELISDRRRQASGLSGDLVDSLFKLIMTESRRIQANVKKDLNQKQAAGS